MKSWKDLIPGAFGCVDKVFAGHPCDKERAGELLSAAIKEGVDFEVYLNTIQEWLVSQGVGDTGVTEQMKKVKTLSTYFR